MFTCSLGAITLHMNRILLNEVLSHNSKKYKITLMVTSSFIQHETILV